MHLIQLFHPAGGRRLAKVDDTKLTLISEEYPTAYSLFEKIINQGSTPEKVIAGITTDDQLDYDLIYTGSGEWKILPAFDHPRQPLMCLLSGTGLTHKASAENRQHMHEKLSNNDDVTDSMKMYLMGETGGKPTSGSIGVQPEWFFKGNGSMLKGLGSSLEVPPYADDGGEEPEIAGIYMISKDGIPYRVGFAMANEFSDHVMEKKNYLYLAPSKLRTCAIGPELVLKNEFQHIKGYVSITRSGKELWSKQIQSGEQHMSHTLENLEYHHFKYDQHRIPGMVHIHFLGADAFSFGDNIQLNDGDWMTVSFDGFGRPLRNPVHISKEQEKPIKVRTLG